MSHDGEKLDPAVDLPYTPEDNGWVVTCTLNYEGNRQQFDMGIHDFGGSDNAAYQVLPEDLVIFIGWQGAFGW